MERRPRAGRHRPHGARALARPRFAGDPFTLGIGSGDPLPDGVVLWTRLAPAPLHGGGMPPRAVPVPWEVAADLDYVSRPGAPVSTRASFVVEDSRPGAVPA